MISIITPFYNSENYIEEAIKSVLSQYHEFWELLLINDGSTDKSKDIALSFSDPRIRYFEQVNQGIASARNIGLSQMRGDYFCFLDSDDFLPPNSLSSRLGVFTQNPSLTYVDGAIRKMDQQLVNVISHWTPSFTGNPLDDLVLLTGRSFVGVSWLIKRNSQTEYLFHNEITHAEDLLFFMELARQGGQYGYTEDVILHYRDTPGSAMTNLMGLESGYRYIENEIRTWPEVSRSAFRTYQYKYRRAMFLAYLRKKQLGNALRSLL
jgi:teichuronic acid biosynthesis glycosyltransferase TuaG